MPRCEVIPQANHQVSFVIDEIERLRWHYGSEYPRPFFYPLLSPSRRCLTRMGHPGAPDHDHHRSIWFAHEKVSGVNFWTDRTAAKIRQKQWLSYQDGNSEAIMAVQLGWYDGHDPKELLEQELIAAIRPGPEGETFLELQSTFRPTAESLEFGKTNFGFLAVRVAKTISAHFGGGLLTSSMGATGEKAIFGSPAKWMDYSGPIHEPLWEGITYYDHPSNPNHPNKWHVRDDGWMAASACMSEPKSISKSAPLQLRYLLHTHRGKIDPSRAEVLFTEFANLKGLEVKKAAQKHTQWEVRRIA